MNQAQQIRESLRQQLKAAIFDRLPKIKGVTFTALDDFNAPVKMVFHDPSGIDRIRYIYLRDKGFGFDGKHYQSLQEVVSAIQKSAVVPLVVKADYDRIKAAYEQLLEELSKLGQGPMNLEEPTLAVDQAVPFLKVRISDNLCVTVDPLPDWGFFAGSELTLFKRLVRVVDFHVPLKASNAATWKCVAHSNPVGFRATFRRVLKEEL